MQTDNRWDDFKTWADERLLSNAYAAISIQVKRFRARLRDAEQPFVDPNNPEQCTIEQANKTAEWVIEQVSVQTGIRNGIASLAGILSVPPEVLATVATLVRLAQKLSVVYGFDPRTDKGQVVMWRALAAGLETPLPESGPVGFRLRDLTKVVSMPSSEQVGAAVTRALVRKSAWMVLRRVTRLVPALSLGSSTIGGRKRMKAAGRRMSQVLQKVSESNWNHQAVIEEAVEVRPA